MQNLERNDPLKVVKLVQNALSSANTDIFFYYIDFHIKF